MNLFDGFASSLLLVAHCAAQDASSGGTDQASEQSIAAAAKASRARVQVEQAKEADIRRLLDLTSAGALATQTMDSMEGNIRPLMTNSFPPGEYSENLIDLFFKKFPSTRDPQHLLVPPTPISEKVAGVNYRLRAVVPFEFQRGRADRLRRDRFRARLEHGQLAGLGVRRLARLASSLAPLFVAQRARAGIAQERKWVSGEVPVFPLNFHAGPGGQAHFDGFRIGGGHGFSIAEAVVGRSSLVTLTFSLPKPSSA